jgi:hypothetical protein
MNKAKILLSAIGLLAVVGGTIAFKAEKKFNGTLFCTYTRGHIPTTVTRWSTSVIGVARYCTTIQGVPAVVTSTVTINI